MGRGGARAWFTGRARKRAACHREEKELYMGTPHRGSQLAACKLLGCAEEKPKVSIDALRRGGGLTVGGQFIVPRLAGLPCSAHQSKGTGSFKILFSSSRLETRIKESCSMKSMLVANQTMRNESE